MTLPKTVGNGAGVLSASLLLFSSLGAIWGMLRPTYQGTVVDGSNLQIDPTAFNVEFNSFASFVAMTGLLGVLVALSTFVLLPGQRSVGMLWWLILVAAVSAYAFFISGGAVAGLLHPPPDAASLAVGDEVSFVPGFNPAIGWIAAPLMAALSFWCGVFLSPEEAES